MPNFSLRLFNFPAERLFKPRKRLSPVLVPKEIKRLLPFKLTAFNDVTNESGFIQFIEYFSFGLGFDNIIDYKEFASTNEFYSFAKTGGLEFENKACHVLAYLFASKRVLQGLVADDTIFSFHLPYLAEAAYDLDCSIALIRLGYFKQALQSLRNVLEATILHAYFAIKDFDYYDLLEKNDESIPVFKNLILFLRSENLLTADIERQLFEVYKILSAAVHSQITKISITKTPIDNVSFDEWFNLFTTVSSIHFQLIIRMIEAGI